jgi:hypothetical protein
MQRGCNSRCSSSAVQRYQRKLLQLQEGATALQSCCHQANTPVHRQLQNDDVPAGILQACVPTWQARLHSHCIWLAAAADTGCPDDHGVPQRQVTAWRMSQKVNLYPSSIPAGLVACRVLGFEQCHELGWRSRSWGCILAVSCDALKHEDHDPCIASRSKLRKPDTVPPIAINITKDLAEH